MHEIRKLRKNDVTGVWYPPPRHEHWQDESDAGRTTDDVNLTPNFRTSCLARMHWSSVFLVLLPSTKHLFVRSLQPLIWWSCLNKAAWTDQSQSTLSTVLDTSAGLCPLQTVTRGTAMLFFDRFGKITNSFRSSTCKILHFTFFGPIKERKKSLCQGKRRAFLDHVPLQPYGARTVSKVKRYQLRIRRFPTRI